MSKPGHAADHGPDEQGAGDGHSGSQAEDALGLELTRHRGHRGTAQVPAK